MLNDRTRSVVLLAALTLAAGGLAPTPAHADPEPVPFDIGWNIYTGDGGDITVPDGAWRKYQFSIDNYGPKHGAETVGGRIVLYSMDQKPSLQLVRTLDDPVVAPQVLNDLPSNGDDYPFGGVLVQVLGDGSPGQYRISTTITQKVYTADNVEESSVTKTESRVFDVVANRDRSIDLTDASLHGRYSSRSVWKGWVDGPEYQDGATIKLYFKPKGGKTRKVYESKLDSHGNKNVKLKRGAIRKRGKLTVKIGGAFLAPSYTLTS